jgi:hypothetical protein
MHGILRTSALGLALCLFAGGAAAASFPYRVLSLEEAEAVVSADRARMEGRLQKRLTDAGAVRERLAVLEAAPELSDHGRERLLHEALNAAQSLVPDAALRAEVARLARRGPEAWIWLEEPGHAPHAVPYAYAGATAGLTLRVWNRKAATGLALARGIDVALHDAAPLSAEDRDAALAEAVLAMPEAALGGAGTALAAALAQGAPVERALAAAAGRARDAALFDALFARGAPARTVHLVPRVRALPEAAAVAVLERIAEPTLADAAAHALAGYADRVPRARETLLARLADPARGAGAAAALASLHDPALASALETRVVRDDLASRRALLALALDGTDASRAALTRLGADRRLPASLRKEIVPWLAH